MQTQSPELAEVALSYRFIEDPGHGWLEVPITELHRLGIAGQVSSYSYRKGDMAYLEEDCDAGLFLDAKRALGEPLRVTEVYQDPTPVRNYARF